MSDLIGQTIGNYVIESLLGTGGMGQVFRGSHQYLDRHAAIKIMHAHLAIDPTFQARFLQEAKTSSTLDHPNVVQIYDFGEQEGRFYLIMELLPDGSLRTLLKRPEAVVPEWSLALGLDLMRQAAEGLGYAHARGMIHRDVKPDNLLLRRLTDLDRAAITGGAQPLILKVADFGLARLAEGHNLTASGMLMGTPAYMSPEQCQGHEIDQRSDIYSLGVVLFEVVTGAVPFRASGPSEAIYKHVYVEPPSPRSIRPGLPDELEEIILTCLAKQPSERFATAAALAQALAGLRLDEAAAGALPLPGRAKRDEPTQGTTVMAVGGSTTAAEAEPAPPVPRMPGQLNFPVVYLVNRAGPTHPPISMESGLLRVGRRDDNDIVLKDEGVSRYHAVIEWDGAAVTVTDLNSSNGTRIGTTQIAPGEPAIWDPDEVLFVDPFWLRVVLPTRSADGTREALPGTPPPIVVPVGFTGAVTAAEVLPAAFTERIVEPEPTVPTQVEPVTVVETPPDLPVETLREVQPVAVDADIVVAEGPAVEALVDATEETKAPPEGEAPETGTPSLGMLTVAEPTIELRVEPAELTVTAGEPAVLQVTARNLGLTPDTVDLLVQGVPEAWVTGGLDPLAIEGGAERTAELTIVVPAEPEPRTGTWPVMVVAQSQQRPELLRTFETRWTVVAPVAPATPAALQLWPDRAAGKADARYTVVLANLEGETERFALAATTTAPALKVTLDDDAVDLAPGASAQVGLAVAAPPRRFGTTATHGFQVTAVNELTGEQRAVGGSFVQRPLVPLWALALVVLALVALGAGAVQALSGGGGDDDDGTQTGTGAPTINAVTVEPEQPAPGQPVVIRWDVDGAEEIEIRPLVDGLDPALGEYRFDDGFDGPTSLTLYAINDDGRDAQPILIAIAGDGATETVGTGATGTSGVPTRGTATVHIVPPGSTSTPARTATRTATRAATATASATNTVTPTDTPAPTPTDTPPPPPPPTPTPTEYVPPPPPTPTPTEYVPPPPPTATPTEYIPQPPTPTPTSPGPGG